MPACGEKQKQVEPQSAGGGDSGDEPGGDQQPDQDLGDRHPHAGECWVGGRKRRQDEPARRTVRETVQLGAYVGGRAGMEKPRIAELLDSGVDERQAEEEAEREECLGGRQSGHVDRGQNCRAG